jgi:hypothetical protein
VPIFRRDTAELRGIRLWGNLVILHRSGCMSDFYKQHNEANFVQVATKIEVVERRLLAEGNPGKGGRQTRDASRLCRQDRSCGWDY